MRLGALGIEDQAGKLDQRRGGLAGIGLEGGAIAHGIVVEIEDTRVDHRVEGRQRQRVAGDCGPQGIGDRVARARAFGTIDGIAPPLQADFAGHGFAHHIAQPGDLGIEGVEGGEIGAMAGGRQQAGEIPVPIEIPQFCQYVVAGNGHLCVGPAHTAISAAATARDSASMTL